MNLTVPFAAMTSSDASAPHVCQETAGFLFKHACGHLADATCQLCQKLICNRHTRLIAEALLCTACARRSHPRDSLNRKDTAWPRDHDYHPYDYSDHHYPGYGRYGHGQWGYWWLADRHHRHDRNDFTAADAEHLHKEEDEGFEQDMGES